MQADPRREVPEWGWVDPDDPFSVEQRQRNRVIRGEEPARDGDAVPAGRSGPSAKRGPLRRLHDVGEGRLTTVADIAARTGLTCEAVYARINRGVRGPALLRVTYRRHTAAQAAQDGA